jgi:hypothetical protein
MTPLPDDEIVFAQITDGRPLDLSRSGGRVGFIWAAKSISRGVITSIYQPIDRDLDRGHDAGWYRANFPDRIVYQCDRTTPATLYQYNWGAYAPVDVTNPQVRQYIMDRFIMPALAEGTTAIALDNASLRNDAKRCGVFRNRQWTQLFSGEQRDPAFSGAVLDWISWLHQRIAQRGGLLALNAKVDEDDPAGTRRLIASGDIWLMEAGFTRDCRERVADGRWRVRMDLARWGAARMPWVDLDKSCASPEHLSLEEAQWIVGNFLIAKGPQSYLAVTHDGDPNMTLRYPPSLNPRVGRPLGDAEQVAGGGMVRRFRDGLVAVNPSSTTPLDLAIPNGSWRTPDGQPISGNLHIPPTSAAVLLSSPH